MVKKSPFIGMDPYIETHDLWDDFHPSLIGEIVHALEDQLSERYVARIGMRSYETVDETNTGVEHRESFIGIRALSPDRPLVTTIEVVSPSNRTENSEGRRQYSEKRQAHLEGAANLVEIDLLRSGTRMPMDTAWPAGPYYLLVCRKQRAPICEVWPAHFTLPLPTIPVPLLPPDADLTLDLQSMFERIFARSRYEIDIDYRKPCSPPLAEAESAWLAERLESVAS